MKKITLFSFLGIALVFASSLHAKDRRIWTGATNNLWDLATPNWSDPNSALSFLPTTTADSATAVFDDTTDSLKVKVVGSMIADSILVNGAKNYLIDVNASGAQISGKGVLVKNGTCTFTMNVLNLLLGGTVINDGRLMMLNQLTPNIFGAQLVMNGGIANFGTTSSSSYPTVTVPIVIPAGKTASFELSRYSYWQSPITGSGDIHIYAGGERTYLGKKNAQPDWSKFTGNVTIDPYVLSGVKPGFYGLILNTNKTFKDSLNGFNMDSTFYNRKLTLNSGVTIGAESGNRAYLVGELNSADTTTLIAGYYKDSTTPRIYYMIGGLNTDVVYPGRIGYIGSKTYNQTGIIKIGSGTYTFTNKNNQMTAGISVRQGKVLICDNNIRGNFNGGTGYNVKVWKTGTIGGTGRIAGNVDCYGTLQPGANGIGTLLLSDSITNASYSKYLTPIKYSFTYMNTSNKSTTFSFQRGGNRTVDLYLREGSTSEFEIANTNSYDKVVLTGKIRFSKDSLSAGKPKIKILLANGYNIKNGDQFKIISAAKLDSAYSNGFNIEYPNANGITWSVATKVDTTLLDKETFTYADHVATYTSADTIVNTVLTTDTMKLSYNVIVTAHVSTALNKITDNSSVSVYPNPTRGEINFNADNADIKSIEILDIQGRIIYRNAYKSPTVKLNLDNLSSGIYYTKVQTTKGVKVDKLVVQ